MRRNRTFVTVLQGSSPEKAQTVIATEDERIVRAVIAEIADCLDFEKTSKSSDSENQVATSAK